MPEWVRIKDPDTGHEISVSAEQAALAGAKPLDKKDAQTPFGGPAPVKYHTTVDEAAASKKGA